MSDFFESINPDKNAAKNTEQANTPELAENYWSKKPERMLPGEILHPLMYSGVAKDTRTNGLYINGEMSIDTDALEPPYYSNRFGLMRVYQSTGEDSPPIDGYIADIRSLTSGAITERELTDEDGEVETSYGFPEPIPLLAYVGINSEGKLEFRGDERLIGAAQILAENVNKMTGNQQKVIEEEPDLDDESLDAILEEALNYAKPTKIETDWRGKDYSI